MRTPRIKTPDLRMPRFLQDLGRDLRDRRLLPLIGVLLVAIAAVPFVLSKSEGEDQPLAAPGAGVAIDEGAGSELAVVAADSGLRDYRRRLGDRPQDPFRQKYTGAPEGAQLEAGDAAAAGADPEAPTGTDPGTGSDPVDFAPGGEPAPAPDPDDPPEPSDPAEPEPAWVVTVRVGAGEETNVRHLSETTVLPDTDNPLLVFRGLNEKGNKAVFRTAATVSAIFGDATCMKGTERCEVLEIEPGFPVAFVFGDGENERIYRLTVVDIEHNR